MKKALSDGTHPTSRDTNQGELFAIVERVLENTFGPNRRMMTLRRQPSEYRTSFAIDELQIGFDDGTVLRMLRKDLSRSGLQQPALLVKPLFLHDPLREIEVYRHVLADAGLGTARCYAAVADPPRERYWLFLERVAGVELYQVGDLSTWKTVAHWLAAMHCRFSQPNDELRRAAPFLRYDAAFYRLWLDRACEFVGQAATRHDPPSRHLFERLVRNYDQVVARLVALPATLIHGEFYASNVLVETSADGVRICAVDWEMAALGPGLVDLAALTAGRWSDEDRSTLAEAYLGGLRASGAAPARLEDLLVALDDCRLHLAVQWLGWSPNWTPPRDHAHDWLAEALVLGRKLGL